MWCITFLDLHISNHPYISRMKITWLCKWSFWCVLEYGLQVFIFVEKNLHLCSSRILICNFYLVSSWSFSCKVVLMSFWISLISVVMAHFLFLVLLIWVFSFFWFISFKFCQFFVSLILYIVLCFHSIKSCPARLLSTHRLWVWLVHILQDSKVHCYLFDIILIVLTQL